MNKFHNDLLPTLFSRFFARNLDIHEYNTRHRHHLRSELCQSTTYQKTIRFQGVTIWNNLLRKDNKYRCSISFPAQNVCLTLK